MPAVEQLEFTPVQLSFELNEPDVVGASRWWMRQQPAMRGLFAGALIATAMSVAYRNPGFYPFAFAGCILTTLSVRYIWSPKRTFRAMRAAARVQSIQLDEREIQITSAESSGRSQWDAIVRVAVGPDAILVFGSRVTFHILPRRAAGAVGIAPIAS